MGAAEAGPSGRPAPSGGSGKGGRSKGTRPKKKVRAAAVAPPVAAGASGATGSVAGGITGLSGLSGAGGAVPGGGVGELGGDLVRMFPSSMDEYRQGCLRLEKFRHDKLFQSEKRYQYANKAIEATYQWELRSCEDDYSAGCRLLVERYLMDNLARTQRIEERRFGITHRPSEASIAADTYNAARDNDGSANQGRPHGMALRTRNGSGDERNADGGDGELGGNIIMSVDGGRTSSRRSRKETAAKNNGNANGGSGNHDGNSNKPRVTLMMALNEADVASDLAKINRGKRGREHEAAPVQSERRYKKRK